ncbi:hypothetical protein D4R99_02740 [bacterium]|nr:MAG: hypothetical protein D4R99_02740 [bacterium]
MRIADITRITKDSKILLYELKKDGRTIHDVSDVLKNMKNHGAKGVSSQQHRHWTAQMSIINRKISIPIIEGDRVKDEHRADIIDSNITIFNHLKEVNKLIKLTTKSGYEQMELEEGYYVEIMAFDTILSDTKNFEKSPLIKRMKDLRTKQPTWLNEQNARNIDIESFDSLPPEGLQFPRNLTPQSVLPFSTRDCVRLMMGILKIRVTLNVDILIKRLKESGWNVTEVEHLAKPKKERTLSGEFLPEHPSEDFLILTRLADGGKYNVVLPLTLILIAMSSYYQIKFIIDASEATEKAGSEKTGTNQFAINFTQEQTILK